MMYLILSWGTSEVFPGDAKQKVYNQGKLYTIEGFRKEFTKISIGEESVSYWDGSHNHKSTIELNNIARVEIQTGTRAIQFALIGSGLALLITSVTVLPSDVDGGLKLSLISGITIGSGLLNLAYGATMKKYTTVYKNPRLENETKTSVMVPK